jgi:hypothetical protein
MSGAVRIPFIIAIRVSKRIFKRLSKHFAALNNSAKIILNQGSAPAAVLYQVLPAKRLQPEQQEHQETIQ